MPETLTLTRPDDWHLHVRDGAALAAVVPHTASQFGRAIIMPNLKPPVTTAAQAAANRQRILEAVPRGVDFLLSVNRLNVAISRGQWRAYLVHSPGLREHLPATPEGVAQLSAFLRLLR